MVCNHLCGPERIGTSSSSILVDRVEHDSSTRTSRHGTCGGSCSTSTKGSSENSSADDGSNDTTSETSGEGNVEWSSRSEAVNSTSSINADADGGLIVTKDLCKRVVVTIVVFAVDFNGTIWQGLDSHTFSGVDTDTSVGAVIRASRWDSLDWRDTGGQSVVGRTVNILGTNTIVETVSAVLRSTPDAEEARSTSNCETSRAVSSVQAFTGLGWWLNKSSTSRSSVVVNSITGTDAASIDTVSVSVTEGSIVEARWDWCRWDNTSVTFILGAFGVGGTFSLNQRGIDISSNGRIRAPRALDSNSVVDTRGTVDGRISKVVFTSWRRWGSNASVQFRSTTFSNRMTGSLGEGEVGWLNSDVLWAPGTLDS